MTSPKQRASRRRALKRKWSGFKSGSTLLEEVIRKIPYPLIACSFSGGRDSLAATLLTLDALQYLGKEHRCHVVFNNTGNEFSETVKYVRCMFTWLKENYPNLNIITTETFPEVPFSKMMEDMFYVAVEMHEKGKWDKYKLTCCDVVKLDPLKRFFRQHTVNLLVSGIRGDESRQRFLALFAHSPVHLGVHKSIHCGRKVTPLWDWSTDGVQRFLENHPKKPPINPLYQRGATGVGCMMCPVPFIFARDEIKAWYPEKVYEKGMSLLRKAIERTGQSLLSSYIGREIALENGNSLYGRSEPVSTF